MLILKKNCYKDDSLLSHWCIALIDEHNENEGMIKEQKTSPFGI